MLKVRPEKFFVYCALLFGILLITIIPPFQSPDEDSHFKKAYVISKGQLFPTSLDGKIGYELPVNMITYINEQLTYMGDRDKKYTYGEEISDDRSSNDYSEVIFQHFSTAEVTPIAYVAPATGIVFSKVITKLIGMDNISVATMLHFARAFSLLLYILLVCLAIKTTPILKKTFCVIGLLPMSLALASTISYDSILIAVTLLSTALIFKLIFDDNVKKVSYKYFIAFGVIAFILLSIKVIYITVLLPLIFIPKEKYDGKIKEIIKCFGIMVAIAIALYAINKIPLMNLQSNTTESNALEQLKYIIINPIDYLKTLLKTMWFDRSYYFSGMIGIFGLIDTYIPTIYLVIYSLGALGVVISDFSLCPVKFNWKYKGISILGSVATICAAFTGLYVFWTSSELGVGVETITGVQGRYFIPIIPLAMIVLSNSVLKKSEKIKNIMEKILNNSYFVPIMALCITLVTIFERYWC